MIGGIDLGGTKIEARVFDGPDARTVAVHRIATPLSSYEALCDGLMAQIDWIEAQAGSSAVPVGLSFPGIIDAVTGESYASNVPTTGQSIAATLRQRRGRDFTVINDCMAFTYSEAHGGAAEGHPVVVGLILGTGVGGGVCIDGALPTRHAGLAVEVGHLGVSGRALGRHDLPLFPCGCGAQGCVETYISGSGLSNVAEWKTGTRTPAHEITAEDILSIWADIAGETLAALQLMLDPHCIVIGGGVSNMPGIAERLAAAMARCRLGTARQPVIVTAKHGDSSGARGAALLATRGNRC
jgi:N-acetylglucosamine kinase